MDSVQILLSHVLHDITPTEKEKAKEKEMADEIITILNAVVSGINEKVESIMVGSIAKNTDLSGDKDFDIFLQFPKDIERAQLEDEGLLMGKKFFEFVKGKTEISYAEHPYVKGKYHGFTVEIVPCYRMGKGSKIMSAVDRSPLHTKVVVGELAKKPKLTDDIRLLKKFMKGNDIYGAHAAVEGFSGYLCELLSIKYGSFMDVLKAAINWQNHEHLELEGTKAKKKFADVPLVFIDPVDGTRNVAAAVSVEKLANFIFAAKSFLDKPTKDFFYAKERTAMTRKEFYKKLKTRGTQLIMVKFKAPKLIEDTLIPQLSKSLRAIVHECERAGFSILKEDFWTDGKEAAFMIEFEVWKLPRVMKKQGPFFDSKVADLNGFLESNKLKAISQPYLEDGHWTLDVQREFRHADDLVVTYLKDPKGFGKNMREVEKVDFRIDSEIQKIKNHDFWVFMADFW